jgi:GntR family transcriptional regulator, arabinose operon transcriptional repressor
MGATYSEVKSRVRQAIAVGRYKPNDKLPSDHDLATEFRTSRLTVHRALRELAGEGLIHRSPRRGTLVADPKTSIVGMAALMLPDSLSSRATEWVSALGEDLLNAGISLVPYICHGSVARARQIASLLVRNPVLGVILVPPTYEDSLEIITIFKEAGMPVVVEGKFDLPGVDVSYVSTNHRQGGRILAEHLVKVGHRRLAIVTGSHTQDVAERCEGFNEVAARAHCPVGKESIFEVTYFSEIPYVVRELMSRPDRPSAIFGVNDEYAAEVMVALADLGFKVPGDCAVVGMGDERMSKATLSPMTTVRAPWAQEGHILAGVFLNTIDGRLTEPQKIELDYELVVRKSCGAGTGNF